MPSATLAYGNFVEPTRYVSITDCASKKQFTSKEGGMVWRGWLTSCGPFRFC
jgi:hypothetical protein